MKNVIITGATGMVGGLILENCLLSDEISTVTILARKTTGKKHTKLKEVIHNDFTDYTIVQQAFHNIDIAFFCIGAYTGKVPDELFKKITVDIPVAFAKTLKANSPHASLCFLSGAGADRTEKSKLAFARYKGMAENQLSALGLGGFYSFRPAYIYPVTPREEPSWVYRLTRALYPLIKLMGENSSIKSTELASSMLRVGLQGAESEVLENRDILKYV